MKVLTPLVLHNLNNVEPFLTSVLELRQSDVVTKFHVVRRIDIPDFEPVDVTLDMLLTEGNRLAEEQDRVNSLKLSVEYLKNTGNGGSLIGLKG